MKAVSANDDYSLRVEKAGSDELGSLYDGFNKMLAQIQTRDADQVAARVHNAGAIFVGPWAPVSLGDYVAGSNHVLPTAGAGRAYSPLGVESFGRWMQVNRVTRDGLARILPAVAAVAEAEAAGAARKEAMKAVAAQYGGPTREVFDAVVGRRSEP